VARGEYWLKVCVLSVLTTYILAMLASIRAADPDLWGYLAFGRLFWQSQGFPYRDVFSYIPNLPWVYHEWLTGTLFYPLYQTLGSPGLMILQYGLALGTSGLVYLTARRRGAYPLSAVLLLLIYVAVCRYWYSPVRAQVFTFFFFALYLYLLESARLGQRWQGLYLLPLIQIPWCNLHGGSLAGLGLIAIYACGELIGRRPSLPYFLAGLAAALVTLINPYGVGYWEYLGRAVAMPRPQITEWLSVVQAYRQGVIPGMLIIFLLLLGVFGALGMWQYQWREITASLGLAITLALGLRHIRHLPFFFILAGAYFPVCINQNVAYLLTRPRINQWWQGTSVKRGVAMGLGLLTVLNLYLFIIKDPFAWKLPDTSLPPEIKTPVCYPVAAVNLIKKQGLAGKILTKFVWGEYLIWKLYPQGLVGMDGRYETVYPPKVQKTYFAFYNGDPQWRQFLRDYPPDLILLDKSMAVVALIRKEPGWREIYADSHSVLFARGPGGLATAK
jgi:hypothetical protein